uniref:GGACT domain-containing protein n=1 Tax=Caenorhabditis tropicalis TaxID=1561998 RepID=A0A1I7TW34_9PELO
MSEWSYTNREKQIHEKVFDTLSRPLSRASKAKSDGNQSSRESPSQSPLVYFFVGSMSLSEGIRNGTELTKGDPATVTTLLTPNT